METVANKEQARPHGDKHIDICGLVKKDVEARAQLGEKRYGERLHPFNGRNPLVDAYQEALDLVIYLRQALLEQEHDEPIRQSGLRNHTATGWT